MPLSDTGGLFGETNLSKSRRMAPVDWAPWSLLIWPCQEDRSPYGLTLLGVGHSLVTQRKANVGAPLDCCRYIYQNIIANRVDGC
ncbi:hypothetical protein Mnod_2096 [Methylobacterium nodulans ORS 2060]|uniref:Uncharacterized protein n=1 Tax=Methylobacterium nodulans (strain LMG 21967 / CNCM I-2342 / ORS 2060) TaxID=460265 RepID=B8IUL3_METNO|nr:hypothetical protein Mnod_2096 [Methylobacterium nodulans ORS 2060]